MKFFIPFFEKLQKIPQSSRSSVKKFVIFAIVFGLINFSVRIMLFFVISPLNLNEEAISLIAFLVTLSTSISIVIFFIKRYYADEIKKKLS